MRRDAVLLAVGAGIGGAAAAVAAALLLRPTAPATRASELEDENPAAAGWCLRLSQEILLPSSAEAVAGRLDHFAFDAANQILYLACLGSNAVLEIDTFAGVVLRIWNKHHLELNRPQVRCRACRSSGLSLNSPLLGCRACCSSRRPSTCTWQTLAMASST